MTILTILVVWFLGLAAFVALKARQPKWQHPSPPRVADVAPGRLTDAA